MGMQIDRTDVPDQELGEYEVEIKQESFYIVGDDTHDGKICRHAIDVYPNQTRRQGMIEILIEDIPKIRACLDVVEAYVKKRNG